MIIVRWTNTISGQHHRDNIIGRWISNSSNHFHSNIDISWIANPCRAVSYEEMYRTLMVQTPFDLFVKCVSTVDLSCGIQRTVVVAVHGCSFPSVPNTEQHSD